MDKVLVLIPDNNKGKYISKGYISAFKDLNFFVIEKKIYDLNIDEVNHLNPNIIFCFWSEMNQNDIVIDFFKSYSGSADIISCAELSSDIPEFMKKKSYCFYPDTDDKKHKLILGINPKDYKDKFRGYNYTITFAGNPAFENREKLLSALISNFGPINIFCRSFDFYKRMFDIPVAQMISMYGIKEKFQDEIVKEISDGKTNGDLQHSNSKEVMNQPTVHENGSKDSKTNKGKDTNERTH